MRKNLAIVAGVVAGTCFPGTAFAQEEISVSDQEPAVFVGAVQVTGASAVGLEIFGPVIEEMIGRKIPESELSTIARAIADAARANGYIFATAYVPPQEIRTGIVKVAFDAGAIDEVRVVGSDNARVRALLDILRGPAPRKDAMERQILLIDDVPGIRLKDTNYAREDGKGVLTVIVEERRERAFAAIDNSGSPSFGPVRLRLSYQLAGVLADDDVLAIQAVSTIAQPTELFYESLRYTKQVDNRGTKIGFSAGGGRTEAGGAAAAYDLVGRTVTASVFAGTPILRTKAQSLWVNVELGHQRITLERAGADALRDAVTTIALSFNGSAKWLGGRLTSGFGVVQGLNLFEPTAKGEPLSSRRDADGTFTRLESYATWFGPLQRDLNLKLSFTAQAAWEPLLTGQSFSAGGTHIGRGYNFSEIRGDRGVSALAELRANIPGLPDAVDWAHAYLFVDGAYVDFIDRASTRDTLASTGGGVRAGLGKLELGLEGALPLDGARAASGKRSVKWNLVAGLAF